MAGIDKIYGSNEQYDEFFDWCKNNYPDALNYFYGRDDYEPPDDRAICNFPMPMTWWMLENCPIQFVIDRVKFQLGL